MSGCKTVVYSSHTPATTWSGSEGGREAELTKVTEEERRIQERARRLIMMTDRW